MPPLSKLRQRFDLHIDAPFNVKIDGVTYQFEYRVVGYGAEHGMVVDGDWSKIEPIANRLVEMGFGFSCFKLDPENVDGFQQVLDDWGISSQ